MKILVSTLRLYTELNKISETDAVQSALLRDHTLTLYTRDQVLEIPVEPVPPIKSGEMIGQQNRRWDWVRSLMKIVHEQPVVLDIYPQRIDIIFQY